jgi:hypothetical protein
MIVLTSAEFFRLIKEATGLTPNMMDKTYCAPDECWPIKSPSMFGFKRYEYSTESMDCDDFCRICEFEWLSRHIKDKSAAGYALPMGTAVIDRPDGKRHAINFIVVDMYGKAVLRFFERRQDGVYVPDITGKFSEVYT